MTTKIQGMQTLFPDAVYHPLHNSTTYVGSGEQLYECLLSSLHKTQKPPIVPPSYRTKAQPLKIQKSLWPTSAQVSQTQTCVHACTSELRTTGLLARSHPPENMREQHRKHEKTAADHEKNMISLLPVHANRYFFNTLSRDKRKWRHSVKRQHLT